MMLCNIRWYRSIKFSSAKSDIKKGVWDINEERLLFLAAIVCDAPTASMCLHYVTQLFIMLISYPIFAVQGGAKRERERISPDGRRYLNFCLQGIGVQL